MSYYRPFDPFEFQKEYPFLDLSVSENLFHTSSQEAVVLNFIQTIRIRTFENVTCRK